MKKIAFIYLNKNIVSENLLKICSSYTPLLEPAAENEVFLDLSGYRQAGQIINKIAEEICTEYSNRAEIGLASSKLLARISVLRKNLPARQQGKISYRIISSKKAFIIQVLPGKEEDFMASLPLQEFYPLGSKEVKKLHRMGFSSMGEIAALSRQDLINLLGQDAYSLWQNSRGIDLSPVMGLYPPLQLIYPFDFMGEYSSYTGIETVIKTAVTSLTKVLEKKHSGAKKIILELYGEKFYKEERLLSNPAYRTEQILNIVLKLWQRLSLQEALDKIVIILADISPLQMVEQDLFTTRISFERERKEIKREDILENLKNRFPGMIYLGPVINRREQVLALWDPWRFETETGMTISEFSSASKVL